MVNELAKKECRCHGTSTSCTIKTCWNRVASLELVATALKESYSKAKQVHPFKNKRNKWRITEKLQSKLSLENNRIYPSNNKRVNSLDMVHVDQSPDFCNPGLYGPGTKGRECNLTNNTCSVLCCGRGYSSVAVTVASRCRCTAQWCCEVKCEQCEHVETRLQCNWNKGRGRKLVLNIFIDQYCDNKRLMVSIYWIYSFLSD